MTTNAITFRWHGKLPKLNSNISYWIEVRQLEKPKPGDRTTENWLKQALVATAKKVEEHFIEGELAATTTEETMDLWKMLLGFPPSFRFDIFYFADDKNRSKRVIFTCVLNLSMLRLRPSDSAKAIGAWLVSMLLKSETAYYLNPDRETDGWYLQLILARCKELIKPYPHER